MWEGLPCREEPRKLEPTSYERGCLVVGAALWEGLPCREEPRKLEPTSYERGCLVGVAEPTCYVLLLLYIA